MDRRSTFRATLDHKEPAFVLVDYGKHIGSFHINAYERLKHHLGIQTETRILDRMAQNVILDEEICKHLGIDFRWVIPNWVGIQEITIAGQPGYIDMWQTAHKWTDIGQYYAIHSSPFNKKILSLEDIELFNWPDPANPAMFTGLQEKAQHWHETTDYILGADGIKVGILQTAAQLRGYDKLFMDFAINPDTFHAFLDKTSSIINEMYLHYMQAIGAYVQVVVITDDLGTQTSLMISPAMFREFIKPHLKSLIQTIKTAADVKVMMHCDGAIVKIIPDLIEIGVDILNPIQTVVKGLEDTRALKEQFGDQICFHGGIDIQQVLRTATPQAIRSEVARRISDLGASGGYILAPCHNINTDIPIENVLALFDAAREVSPHPLGY